MKSTKQVYSKFLATLRLAAVILIICFSLQASAQKDSVRYDTAFVFSVKDVQSLKNILMESKVIINGNQLTGKELQELFAWIDNKGQLFKKNK